MATQYRVISWDDEATGFNAVRQVSLLDTFPSLAEAVTHLRNAGDYIVALDEGCQRDLTPDEDRERKRIQDEYRQQAS